MLVGQSLLSKHTSPTNIFHSLGINNLRKMMNSKKKLIIYISYPCYSMLETELEIIDKYINKNYEVLILSCMGELATCQANINHRKYVCKSCKSRLHAGYKWLNSREVALKQMYNITPQQSQEAKSILSKSILSWEDFRNIKIDTDDIGDAAYSELLTTLYESQPEFNTKNLKYAKKLLKNALIVHFSIKNHLISENPDEFILCNGRISSYRPALRMGISLGVETKVLDISNAGHGKYVLIKNHYPHDPVIVATEIQNAYQSSGLKEGEKESIASQWFNERINNAETQQSFTSKQKEGLIPNIIKSYPNLKIGIFISSEQEGFAIKEMKNPFYDDQNSAISRITEDLKSKKILFIVRAHPHLMGLNNTQIKKLENICNFKENIYYIPPESKISSYELINYCDIILSFGSTVGIEAVYLNKPSILMGNSVYKGFGGNIEPESHESLVKILEESAKTGNLPRKYLPSKEAMKHAITMYGFGLQNFGIKREYQKNNSLDEKSWIEKDGEKCYIQPMLLYRIVDFFLHKYWIIKHKLISKRY